MLRRLFLGCWLFALIGGAAWAGLSAEEADRLIERARGNDKQAVSALREAAGRGDARGQFSYGVLLDFGYGVPQDDREAVKWYRLAAEQGDATAQNYLGLMYDGGRGVPQDQVLAYALYNLAAANGNEQAARNRDALRAEMTPSQIDAAQAISRGWRPGMPLPPEAQQPGGKPPGRRPPGDKAAPKKPQAGGASHPIKPASADGDCRPRGPTIHCQSQCFNGDCIVTYENGCRIRVQVSPRFDPFSNQWTYPSPSC